MCEVRTESVIYGGRDGNRTSCFFVCDRAEESLSVYVVKLPTSAPACVNAVPTNDAEGFLCPGFVSS